MLAALRAAQSAGAEVAGLDPWSRDSQFDVLHFWGLDAQHANAAYWAQRAGKKIVISALLPYPGLNARLRHVASILVGPARQHRELLRRAQLLTVVNSLQADYAVSTLNVPRSKVVVIP